ncbi:AI-2E family transporter [Natrialbaceae archaeon AArc-T1-2]|uniref:AI-2E family transporter n=1 Tax=Natrialbaceae archaeon AArc-T1-2 TaxID=3053904 RepID=UPI00255AD2E0|nr:AI-2E family transporter [Natrialbaceae archaeon AArc-T1-2]WIV67816.1 AI-2E family transporter [Natrialbaceae archaeon AArc-T1-2]
MAGTYPSAYAIARVNLRKGYLLALVTIFGGLSLLLVLPFLQYVLGAILVAFVLHPLQKRLAPVTSPTISALALVLLAIVGVLVPFVVVIGMVAGDAAQLVERIDPADLQVSELEETIEETTGYEVDLAQELAESAEEIATAVIDLSAAWLGLATHTLIGLGLTLFLLYYLLKDGTEFVAWLRETTPLPEEVQDDLYRELDEVMWAVLAGHVLIAIVEGVIAGLGLFVTGIPNATFWTFVMVILSLVPLIGAFLVWGPAVAYLVLTGEPLLAIGLFVYSAIVVGVADDYLRPIVVDRYAELSPAVIILGVLGGIYAFGVMGIFFGPVVLGAFAATLSVVDDYYDRLEDEPEAGSG